MNQKLGNAIVGQSGGPTAAINATLSGVIRGVREGVHGGVIRTLYGMRNGVEGFLREELINLTECFDDEDKLELLERTPASALGSCRKRLPDPHSGDGIYDRIFSIFRKYDIRYFFYIGGNDSMDTVAKLSEYARSKGEDIVILGIPKTIDNDLMETDHTPGYGSAAKYVAVATQEIIRDCAVYRIPAVTIIEIMGRDSGWLTAASAVGRKINGIEPDLVYLPERSFSNTQFLSDVKRVLEDHPNVVVAVSEGLRYANGCYVSESESGEPRDEYGHLRLSGTGKVLEMLIRREIGCKVRSVELNLPQRCAAHLLSKTDITESIQIGRSAVVFAAIKGITSAMLTIIRRSNQPYRIEIGCVAAAGVANRVKNVEDPYINSEGNHITDACCDYIAPLIQGEMGSKFVNGLPTHFVF